MVRSVTVYEVVCDFCGETRQQRSRPLTGVSIHMRDVATPPFVHPCAACMAKLQDNETAERMVRETFADVSEAAKPFEEVA